MEWQAQIPACFGIADRIFAGHAADEKRAKKAIKDAKAAGAKFEDFEKEIVWYCYKQAGLPELLGSHIATQVKTAKRMWG